MDFATYQKQARKTAIYPQLGHNFVYPVLGLVGEAGEVAEKIKKVLRDEKGKITDEKREELKKELGDVLWYLANLSVELKIPFEKVAEDNIQKLKSRLLRSKLKGSGDNR